MNPRPPRRPIRRCNCRPSCLSPIVPGDQVTPAGALLDHAHLVQVAATAAADVTTSTRSPLSRLHNTGGVPRRL